MMVSLCTNEDTEVYGSPLCTLYASQKLLSDRLSSYCFEFTGVKS